MKKVILLIETTHAYGRSLLRGITRYSKIHGPWSFYSEAPFYGQSKKITESIAALKKINADGIIVREPERMNVEKLIKLGVPVIVSPNIVNTSIPAVITAADKISQLAAEHLSGRGFRNFAFCGFKGLEWAQNRGESFSTYIESKGFRVQSFFCDIESFLNPNQKALKSVIDWLESLPKPVGLMACNDDMGRVILEMCKHAHIAVPEQVAVVGVDDDDLTCELTDPPLSSVSLDAELAGYQAAELLDKMMDGEEMSGQLICHEPAYVTTRQSTDIVAVEDPDVSMALKYIRKYFKTPVTVDDVANYVSLSRRHLYKKFMIALGHSVHREIKNQRIEHICKLLIETDLTVYQITRSLEFTNIEHISRYFQQEKGISPIEYRKKLRG